MCSALYLAGPLAPRPELSVRPVCRSRRHFVLVANTASNRWLRVPTRSRRQAANHDPMSRQMPKHNDQQLSSETRKAHEAVDRRAPMNQYCGCVVGELQPPADGIRRSSERAGAALGHAAGSVDWRSVSIATTALTHAASNGDTTGCHHAALTASLSLGVVRIVCVSWRRRYAALSSGAMLRVA